MNLGLSVRETGWLLSRTEPQVRRLIQNGRLRYAVRPTRLSTESVRALFAEDSLRPIRETALTAILDGRLRVPAPPKRYASRYRSPTCRNSCMRYIHETRSNTVSDCRRRTDRFRNTRTLQSCIAGGLY